MPLTNLEQLAYDLIQRLEWKGAHLSQANRYCPICGESDMGGHRESCSLVQTMRRLEQAAKV